VREIWQLLDSRGLGGIESHVAELACGLREVGRATRVVFLRDYGSHPLHTRLAQDGVPWEALPGGAQSLYYRLRSGQPSLLHTHGYKANLLGRAAARLLGIPVIATFHAGDRPGGWLAVYDIADRWTAFLGGRIAVSRPIRTRAWRIPKSLPLSGG
jgi:glycosyltransferase involved in cell wall biosynthesis